jgi:GH15 family glucan-1,4-alpha-glucosidase
VYPYGLIGNCQAAALIQKDGSLDWLCFPRPDSPPVFGRLLDPEGGAFRVELLDLAGCEQGYLENTNVLVTTLCARDGSRLRITDFCPRFAQYGRMYRPNAVFRVVEPVSGNPMIRVSCKPVSGWDKSPVRPTQGNNHLRFEIGDDLLRLLTDMPLTYLVDETPFALKGPIYFALTYGPGLEGDLVRTTQSFLEQTTDYWRTWVKHCFIPTHYQGQTIRSALTLKLHCYEDTGAILAALTTSLPEEVGRERNWDYRFCWLRDAYFALSAFHSLGHFEEMEGFINFLLNLVESRGFSRDGLGPVYRLDQTLPVPEVEHANWCGFLRSSPVRSGNQAAHHEQNDVYGEMILTLAPIFFDDRFKHLRSRQQEALLAHLAKMCVSSISKPDAGLWELRNGWQEHSFANLMCWAGLERVERLKGLGFLGDFPHERVLAAKAKAEAALTKAVHDGALCNGPGDPTVDASLLQLPILRFPDLELCRRTVARIREQLGVDGHRSFLYRYLRKDDFGHPQSAFLICSFWLVQALSRLGNLTEANAVMRDAVAAANALGLFSEHYLPGGRGQVGNFPQAYSHVGLINAAFAVSPSWGEVL